MPQARRKKTTKRTTARRPSGTRAAKSSRSGGSRAHQVSLDRFNKSLDAAERALKDLGKNLGRGGGDLLNNVQKMLGDARRDTGKLSSSVLSDIQGLQKSIGSGRGGSRSTSRRSTSSRSTATRRKTAAKRSPSARRSSGSTRRSTASKARSRTAKKS